MHRFIRMALISFMIFSMQPSYGASANQSPIYMSPRPGAEYVSPGTTIAVRFGELLDSKQLAQELFQVIGSRSGKHSGKNILAADGETLLFKPEAAFQTGESVSVRINKGVQGLSGKVFDEYSYSFLVSTADAAIHRMDNLADVGNQMPLDPTIQGSIPAAAANSLTLPADLPTYKVTSNPIAANEGYIFLSPFDWSRKDLTGYLLIIDNQGNLVYYSRTSNYRLLDFQKQPNGMLSYLDERDRSFHVLNSHYQTVDTWSAGNGYQTDFHDFRLLANGHALILIYDYQTVDLSKVVAGGKPNATVAGLVIQEIDQNKNVVFEWRSWDHFSLFETVVPLTDSFIDPVHGNAVEEDYDGNLLLSSRHMNEITKINRNTGEIIWRLGGKANQFQFTGGETRWFSHQHDIRRLANQHITVFDNGNDLVPEYSRAVEFALDEVNKKITKVWEYQDTPTIYSLAMGNTQRLSSGNTMIGWGSNFSVAAIEVQPDGTKLFELSFTAAPNTIVSYRAFRFPWIGDPVEKPMLAYLKTTDTLTLGFSWNGATDVSSYDIYSGSTVHSLQKIGQVPKSGFETQTVLSGTAAQACAYQVVPVNSQGQSMLPSNFVAPNPSCQPYKFFFPVAQD